MHRIEKGRRAVLALTIGFLLMLGFSVAGQAGESGSDPRPAADSRVDINRADVGQLAELPGVGPALAQRIVEFREQNGPFRRVEDLLKVKGIGEKSFQKLKSAVTVGDPPSRG